MYTAAQSDKMWVVLKDGHLFMTTHSKKSADHIVLSMNNAITPTPLSYNTTQIFNTLSDRDTSDRPH